MVSMYDVDEDVLAWVYTFYFIFPDISGYKIHEITEHWLIFLVHTRQFQLRAFETPGAAVAQYRR